MGTYTEEIARGAEFLDERQPGWRDRIDLAALNLDECTTCVLGQLANGADEMYWHQVRRYFGLDYDGAIAHGFQLSNFHDGDDYALLTQEWREYIESSRVVAP